jgi:transposase
LSQGRKKPPAPALFVPSGDPYRHIPRGHFYERLAEKLDLEFVYGLTKPLYAPVMGRPSLDPVVFFKCMLAGFFEGVVDDIQLEYRIADSLTLRRFLGYGLDERTPDESTLRKTRRAMPDETFRAVFSKVLDLCQEAGLLKGRAVGIDSTQVDANASMDSLRHKSLGCTYEEYILALRRQDAAEATREEAARADRGREGKASNQVWESATDPEARVMQHSDGHTHPSYRVDATVDLESGVIVCAGAELANVSDQTDCVARVDEAEAALLERGLKLGAVVMDKGFHSQDNLEALDGRELFVVISSPSRERGKPGFRRGDFTHDPETDTLACPGGKRLRRLPAPEGARQREYRAKGSECRACPHFGTCTKSRKGRAVSIPVREDLIRENRERGRSGLGRPLARIRRQRGEAPFGHFKRHGGLRRFQGRGLDYANKKTLIAAAGWNLLRLMSEETRKHASGEGGAGQEGPKTAANTPIRGLRQRNGARTGPSGASGALGRRFPAENAWKQTLCGPQIRRVKNTPLSVAC